MDRQEPQRHRRGRRCAATSPSPDCEINFASLPPNFGIAALNEYGEYPRTWNLEQGVEVSHELLGGLSVERVVVEG